MIAGIKRFLYKRLSTNSYLRVMQVGFLTAYRLGVLRGKKQFANHYFIKQLVKKGDTVIDIGANLGYYSIPLSRIVGKQGRVYAVEPIALYNDVFNKAARRCRNITLLPYALGDSEGEVMLVNSLKGGYLNTGLPHVYDPARDGDAGEQDFTFPAQMKRPSALFAVLERIDYIKCDIEGLEYTVLSEMKDVIAARRPIVQVEVWEQNEALLLGMFASMGYTPHRLENGKLTPAAECSPVNTSDYILIPN